MNSNPISIKDLYYLKRSAGNTSSVPSEFQLAAVLTADLTGVRNRRPKAKIENRIEFSETFRKIATEAVTSEDGRIFESIGETLLAVFNDPVKSVVSGISMVKAFNHSIEENPCYSDVRMRIAIHYGNVHVEDQEAVGGAVSFCIGVLSVVSPGGGVWITDPLYHEIKNQIQELELNAVSVSPGAQSVDPDIPLYQLVFEGMPSAETNNDYTALMLLTPLFHLGCDKFRRLWSEIQNDEDLFEHHSILKRQAKGEDEEPFVRLDMQGAQYAAEFGQDFLKRLRDRCLSRIDSPFIPLALIILRRSEIEGEASFNLVSHQNGELPLEPETVFISAKAAAGLDRAWDLSPRLVYGNDKKAGRTYHRINPEDSPSKKEDSLFNYRHAILKGKHSPCFFCSGKDHFAVDCPSKRLEKASYAAIQELSRNDIDEMNKLWFHVLNRSADGHKNSDLLDNIAYRAFFDINLVFQRRFCQAVWSSDQNNWDDLRKGDSYAGNHPANECLKVEDANDIESRIEAAIHHYPYNFGLHCALGLVLVEKNDIERALQTFRQALIFAETSLQKALVHLLIFRIEELGGDLISAEKELAKVLSAVRYCPEAEYFRIRLKFQQGMTDSAESDLETLVGAHPEFFTIALLDPSLTPYDRSIQAELTYLLGLALQRLDIKLDEAADLVRNVDTVMKPSESPREFYQELSTIKSLREKKSFSGYHEASAAADDLAVKIKRYKEDRKRRILRSLNELIDKCAVRIIKIEAISYPETSEQLLSDIHKLQTDVVNAKFLVLSEKTNSFSNALEIIDKQKPAFETIDRALEEQEIKGKLSEFGITLLKVYCIIQAVNCFIAMILFPVIVHFILSSFPNLSIPADLIPFYTKIVLILGFVGGLGFSAVIALMQVYPSKS